MTSNHMYTVADLDTLPAHVKRYEILNGNLLQHEYASIGIGLCAGRIIGSIGAYALDNGLGDIVVADAGFLLGIDPTTLLAPDGSFISVERMRAIENEEKFSSVVPDLVVEVVSPSDRSNEVNDKVLEYVSAGVEIVLVVYPRRKTITVYGPDRTSSILTVDDTFDGGTVLPGFRLPIADIFA